MSCDPEKVNGALSGIYTGWIGVIAVLKVQFAKTIALGLAIGNFLYKPAIGFLLPVAVHLVPRTIVPPKMNADQARDFMGNQFEQATFDARAKVEIKVIPTEDGEKKFVQSFITDGQYSDFGYSHKAGDKVADPSYTKWIPTAIAYVCKSIAISIAWYIQRIISAFHSAIKGGLICSRNLLDFLNDRGLIKFNDEESYIDEVFGWFLAVCGFYFQFKMDFHVPWLLSLFLWPLGTAEWYIIWAISD